MNRGNLLLGGGALVTAVIAVLAIVRTDPGASERSKIVQEARAEQLLQDGRREYATIDMIPLSALASVDEVRAAWAATDASQPSPSGAGTTAELLDVVSQFLYYRYVNSDLNTYMSWRASTGYTIQSVQVMKNVFWMHKTYEETLGEPMPEDRGTEYVFGRLWDAAASPAERSTRAIAIAAAAKGQAITFGTYTIDDPNSRRQVSGIMEGALWRGGGCAASPSWWKPATSRADLIKRYGSVPYAEVGVVLEFGSGARRPVVLTAVWDASQSRWRIEFHNQCNFARDDMRVLVW